MSAAVRLVDGVRLALEIVGVALLGVLCVDVLLGVSDRFLFHFGWPWPEELARFLLVWLTFLAAAIAARREAHFVIDFFIDRLFRGRRAEPYRLAMAVAVALVLLIVIVKGSVLTALVASQTSPALGLPMGLVYGAIPVGGFFTLFFVVWNAREKLVSGRAARR